MNYRKAKRVIPYGVRLFIFSDMEVKIKIKYLNNVNVMEYSTHNSILGHEPSINRTFQQIFEDIQIFNDKVRYGIWSILIRRINTAIKEEKNENKKAVLKSCLERCMELEEKNEKIDFIWLEQAFGEY